MKRFALASLAAIALLASTVATATQPTIPTGIAAAQGVAIGGGTATQTVTNPDGTTRTKENIAGVFSDAIGYGAQALGRGDTAVGSFAYTGTVSTTSTDAGEAYRSAFGYKSSATGDYSTSLGAFNVASGRSSVAVGFGSNDDGRNGVVSFGSSTYGDRTLTHVADGTAANDAATVGQLNTVKSDVNAQFVSVNAQINALNSLPVADVTAAQVVAGDAATLASANAYTDTTAAATLSSANAHADAGDKATLGAANAYTDSAVDGLKNWANAQNRNTLQQANKFAAKGIAQALAIPSIPQLAAGQKWVGAAVGHYAGENAVGIAAAYQVSESVNLGAGVSRDASSNSHLAARVQAGYAW